MPDRIDAIFFDNDGVLVDTEPLFLRAAVSAGMRCVAVPTTLSGEGDFSAAEHVLERLADLPALLVG